jgi:predicted transcriptional regulator
MKYFNSNETLEMCDVRISENGNIEVATKSYHSEELQRLGMPEKAIRGRVKVADGVFTFKPYAE